MMDLTKQIISVRENTAVDAAGSITSTIQTTYKLGDFGPFTLPLPRDKFSAAAVNEAIEAMRAQLTGVTS